MGRPALPPRSPSRSPGSNSRIATFWRTVGLAACAVIVVGCVARAQGFEAWNTAWRAEVSDRTGTVASIKVLDQAGSGAGLASDSLRLRNLDPRTIEVAWLGGSCVGETHFSLAPEPHDVIGLRYDVGPPCPIPAAAGYALQIRFLRAVDSTTIEATSDWGP